MINTFVVQDGDSSVIVEDDVTVIHTQEEVVHTFETSAPRGATGAVGGSGGASGKTTLLSITGSKPASSIYSITSSGVNYVKTQEDGLFPDAAATFNATSGITISLNGVIQYKGIQAIWNSTTSFILEMAVDNGDEILIIS